MQKARIYFNTSKFHHKFRAKRKKDREKEVSTLDSVLPVEPSRNGKNGEISRNVLKKVELRFGHTVQQTNLAGEQSWLVAGQTGSRRELCWSWGTEVTHLGWTPLRAWEIETHFRVSESGGDLAAKRPIFFLQISGFHRKNVFSAIYFAQNYAK